MQQQHLTYNGDVQLYLLLVAGHPCFHFNGCLQINLSWTAKTNVRQMTDLLYYQDVNLKQCKSCVIDSTDEGIILDRTVFYPVGGGQPGDSGVFRLQDGSELVIETARRRKQDGTLLHVPAAGAHVERLSKGDNVLAVIDWQRRYEHMRIHTCLHLLSAVIPFGVTGGALRNGTGRLDFDLPEVRLDPARVESELNALVAMGHPVTSRWITSEELEARPELVKTMSVAPPRGVPRVRLVEIAGVDLQACGGTHVSNTMEIGPVVVTKIESKGARNRRVAIALAASTL